MRLKLTMRRSTGAATDLVVDVDASVSVGALADVMQRSDPQGANSLTQGPTFTVEGVALQARTLDPYLPIGESGLGSGQYVQIAASPRSASAGAATLTVLSGPDAGKNFDLSRGVNTVGRDASCTVTLNDKLASKHHAKVIVGDIIEVVDDNSSNGILMGSALVQRAELRPGDTVMIGDSLISVQSRTAPQEPGNTASGFIPFNRSPRLDPQFEGLELTAPEPPTPQNKGRFPVAVMIMPLLMGAILFAFISMAPGGQDGLGKYMTIIFVMLSPMMMLGTYFENKRSAKKDFAEAVILFRQNLAQLLVELRQSQDAERVGRCAEHPSTAEVVAAVRDLSPLIWTRRPEHIPFCNLRLGLGMQPSRTTVEMPNERNAPVDLQHELTSSISPYLWVDNVPIAVEFSASGSLGVSGPEEIRSSIARGLVAQLVGLHSPAEIQLCAITSARSAAHWDWIKWLPHTSGDHSPLASAPLATTAPACAALSSELMDLIAQRASSGDGASEQDAPPPMPVLFVIVEDDAPVERSAMVRIMESGREFGVHVIWMANVTARVPAAARTFLEVQPASFGAATGKVIEAERVQPVVVEPLDVAGAEWLARRLAPVVDIGAVADSASDVPVSVSFLSEVGSDLAESTTSIIDRWSESNSLRIPGVTPRRLKRDNTLRAFVGRTALDPLHLDLRTQGPHALVGGTTGAGKSEFLQTWILGMATAHSPQRVTFLFVDYKGGAAFADCVMLPHTVGLVTDLSPHLVQRALISLRAELRYREHVLNRKKAKDLLELERRGDPECPPSLVLVVDEFAALVQEVPEFVDGVVDIAQRGRSLGLHLILATQRPAGVIKDNLRANTNLRVALRMADEEDSKDVVGIPLAGTFDPGVPGRGIAKTGPGRLALFQSGYVSGWTSDTPPPPKVGMSTLLLGVTEEWEAPEDPAAGSAQDDLGPTDISRLVTNLQQASLEAGVEVPRKPWLPELAEAYDLAALPLPRRDTELVFGVADQPDSQSQGVVAFRPDVDGNIAVFGTGGAGKSAFLRTLAVSAGLTARGGPCFVYGLDFGARGLTMLEGLPHVGSVIGADDAERTARLVSQLKDSLDERAVRFAAVNAATIEEYRRIANKPDEPRVLLLIDGFGAFRNAYEVGPLTKVYDQVMAIATDGRPVGIHVALTGDRMGAVPGSMMGSLQRKLALRLSNEMDESMLGVPRDGFAEGTPPGRGFLDGLELQVAVFGGSIDVATQAAAVAQLAVSMHRAGAVVAPAIESLSERIELASLSPVAEGRPTFAVADATLSEIGFEPSGMFLVAGPSSSGRSTAVATMVTSLRAFKPAAKFAYLGNKRSPLARSGWDRSAVSMADVSTLAEELTESWQEGGGDAENWVLILDGLGEFLNSDADYALQDLLKTCRSNGVFVIADGETSDVQGSWPILQAIKASRYGVVLQPDQMDGDSLFKTQFARMNRAEFPEGRGMFVRNGKAIRVQVAL